MENTNNDILYDETPIAEILRLMNEHDRQERDEHAIVSITEQPIVRMIRVPTVINDEENIYENESVSEHISQEPFESNFIEESIDTKHQNLTPPEPEPVPITPIEPEPMSITPIEPEPVPITPIEPESVPITPIEPEPMSITPIEPEPVPIIPIEPEPMPITPIQPEPMPITPSEPTNKLVEFRQALESVSLDSSIEPVCSITDVAEIIDNNIPSIQDKKKCNCIIM